MSARRRNPEERKRAYANYRERHKAKLAEKARSYQLANPQVYRDAARRHYAKNRTRIIAAKHGVEAAVIEALPRACMICGGAEKLCVDHCHRTGRIRGTLCDHCNRGIGFFRENPKSLVNAMIYIVNGDPDYHDSWHDIVGYAKLVADRLLREAA